MLDQGKGQRDRISQRFNQEIVLVTYLEISAPEITVLRFHGAHFQTARPLLVTGPGYLRGSECQLSVVVVGASSYWTHKAGLDGDKQIGELRHASFRNAALGSPALGE